ncbi:hypothetical protein, partial [Bacillus cereus]
TGAAGSGQLSAFGDFYTIQYSPSVGANQLFPLQSINDALGLTLQNNRILVDIAGIYVVNYFYAPTNSDGVYAMTARLNGNLLQGTSVYSNSGGNKGTQPASNQFIITLEVGDILDFINPGTNAVSILVSGIPGSPVSCGVTLFRIGDAVPNRVFRNSRITTI